MPAKAGTGYTSGMIINLQCAVENYKVTQNGRNKTTFDAQHMTTIFSKLRALFGSGQPVSGHSSLPHSRHSGHSQHSMLHDGSETATRGQLVQVLLRDLVRKSGMPPDWIQCQIQVMNSRTHGKGIYVRLVVKHWDERLMKYAFAFQKALLTNIVQFEPKASSWLQGIAWQLEVASSCPLTELPGPDFWKAPIAIAEPFDQFAIVPLPAGRVMTPKPVQAAVAEPTLPVLAVAATAVSTTAVPAPDTPEPQDETAQDLERLFVIRDNELANMANDGTLPAGYESTQPSPLQKS